MPPPLHSHMIVFLTQPIFTAQNFSPPPPPPQTAIEQVQAQTHSLLTEVDHMRTSVSQLTDRNQHLEEMLTAIVKHHVSCLYSQGLIQLHTYMMRGAFSTISRVNSFNYYSFVTTLSHVYMSVLLYCLQGITLEDEAMPHAPPTSSSRERTKSTSAAARDDGDTTLSEI